MRRSPDFRIMLVDDHPIVRRGIRAILADAYPTAQIEEAGTGAEATALVHAHGWELVILDLTLPDCNGIEVLIRIREQADRLPVLVLSMHPADHFARRAISVGASGYLSKDAADFELVTAVDRIRNGTPYFDPVLLAEMAQGGQPGRHEHPHERLSNREYQVLRMIGGGKTVSQIAHSLELSVKTVSTYRTRVLEKMAMRTNSELTRYALRHDLAD